MLDLPALLAESGPMVPGPLDASPLVVVDAAAPDVDRTLSDGSVADVAPAGAVVVGLLGDERPVPGLLDLLDVALAPRGSRASDLRGVVVSDDVEADLAALHATSARSPHATWALARLLRLTAVLPARDGVVAESATYSSLLAGAEFRRWREENPPIQRPSDLDLSRVALRREGDLLEVTLTRSARRNAYDARMRDALLEALEVAALAPEATVSLRGEGRDFCAGGDLDEFGSAPDPAAAHRLRVVAHPGLATDRLRDRVTVHLHGHCIGSGIEIAAFAGDVRAAESTVLGLPELAMGLVPGAGGTVSLTRRIGRHRVLWWALSGRRIGVELALEWGLVDGVD
ncbi:enoyl-CoA hydratase/isomerase family protein [Nocardioides caeni]|uniref:Enoyl-CoA hydratase/isomerase family protein n=1 Tax=Nocardioides caeni TaxID=574700 RepID=A0A4S8NFY1_9ACTN|nr:enoyl-CoA hydratase/isomerase family protein [Nocardioides caeni]THV14782.1 enoyl-CoA hydratase/isomerase family protein [Nocardioides caeni]